MGISIRENQENRELTVSISGRFDFNLHSEFRSIYKNQERKITKYIIDLRDTQYMDSSALGMLLLLHEQVDGDRSQIKIINCNTEIKKILDLSNFVKMFDIA